MAAPISPDVLKFFTDIQDALKRHPSLTTDIAAVFQFNVKGAGAWVVDCKTPGVGVKAGVSPKVDTTLEYASPADFVAINSGKLDLKRAILTGKFKVHGNYKVIQRMLEAFDAAKKADAAEEAKRAAAATAAATRARAPSYVLEEGGDSGRVEGGGRLGRAGSVSSTSSHDVLGMGAGGGGGGGTPGSVVGGRGSLPAGLVVPEWASDAAVTHCTRCAATFSFIRRKHHCRICGRIFCDRCSSHVVNNKRVCDFCMMRHYRTPPNDGMAIPDPISSNMVPGTVLPAMVPGEGVPTPTAPAGVTRATTPSANLSDMMARGVSLLTAPWQANTGPVGGAPVMRRPSSSTASPLAPSPPPAAQPTAARKGSFVAGLWGAASRPVEVGRAAGGVAGPAPAVPSMPASAGKLLQPMNDAYIADHFVSSPTNAATATASSTTASDGGASSNGPSTSPPPSYARIDDVDVTASPARAPNPSTTRVAPSTAVTDGAVLAPVSGADLVPYSSGSGLGGGSGAVVSGEDVSLAMVEGGAGGTTGNVVAELNAKVQELTARLDELQASTYAHTCLPEVAGATPFSAVMNGELVSTLVQPVVYGLALLGWRVVPALFGWWAFTALASRSWLSFLMHAAIAAWFIVHGAWESKDLFRRRMRIYGAALYTFLDYRLTRWAAASAQLDPSDSEVVWEAAHRRNAVRAFRIIRDLRGLWVKCGQYLSSRPDVMPPAYIKILQALQDAMPARPLAEVKATIEENLCKGGSVDAIFSHIEEKALAAASIGQVHKATLKDGTEVAVKVQHRGMDVIIHQDLENLRIILSWLSWVETGFDLESIMKEWLNEVGSELDFEKEALNMIEVRENMMKTDLPVTVPRVIPGMYCTRVLVMRFIEGTKVNDLDKLRRLGVDRDQLCARVCHAYAHQIYRNGFFNGDPHPGNIMIIRRSKLLASDPSDPDHPRMRRLGGLLPSSPSSAGSGDSEVEDDWVPVLLDFGLTKRLPDQLRLAFAKLVVSAEEMDYAGMLESMDNMGMTFSRESAAEDLENLQYMFRNASPASEARAKHEERERLKKEKEAKKAASAPKGGKQEDRKVTAWPTDLMFYLRASELLQGLCSHLETRHPFMTTMAHAARHAFLDLIPPSEWLATPLYPPLPPAGGGTGMPPAWSTLHPLERLLRVQLTHLELSEALLGCQVVVYDWSTGKYLVNIAAGSRGALDPRAVTPATLFPVFGCSRVGVAAAIAGMVTDHGVSWNDRVDRYWPGWSKAGKGGCTIGELLRGRSGVEGVLPADVSTGHFAASKWDECASVVAAAEPLVLPGLVMARHSRSRGLSMAAHLASLEMARPAQADGPAGAVHLPPIAEGAEEAAGTTSTPAATPAMADASPTTPGTGLTVVKSSAIAVLAPLFSGSKVHSGPPQSMEPTCHLWFGWGWAVGTVVAGMARAHRMLPADGATADGLMAVLRAKFGAKHGMSEHLSFGIPAGNTNHATVCLGGSGVMDAVTFPTDVDTDPATTPAVTSAMAKRRAAATARATMPAAVGEEDNAITMSNALAAMELAEGMTEAGLNDLTALTAGGREHMMDPRVVNMAKVRSAVLPALNCYASAMGLASAAASLATMATATMPYDAVEGGMVRVGHTLYDPAAVWVAHHTGMRPCPVHRPAGAASAATGTAVPARTAEEVVTAFASSGLGGCAVVCDTVRKVSIAVTVNRLTADRAVTQHLLATIANELGLGTPVGGGRWV